MITIFTDGAGWNGQLSEYAFVMYYGKECLHEFHVVTYNEHTNNQMEYKALLSALECIVNNKGYDTISINRIVIRSDSQLIVNQMNGQWKVKDKELKMLHKEAQVNLALIKQPVTIEWTRRAKNRAGRFIERKQRERRKVRRTNRGKN